jgi:predicted metal-dependent HD superfamily phosphohydrolase
MEPRPATVLDRQRWIQLWSRLGASGTGEGVFAQLTAAYGEARRAYHTAQHIQDCLREFDDCRTLAAHPDEIEVALWFHDAVYLPGAADNEEKSADLARRTLTEAQVPPEVVRRTTNLVLVTRHVSPPAERDEQLICDIDLSVLGREPEQFAEFEKQIRREYAWVPEAVYRRERSAVLARFLGWGSIYGTQRFRDRYEARARDNMKRLLTELTAG